MRQFAATIYLLLILVVSFSCAAHDDLDNLSSETRDIPNEVLFNPFMKKFKCFVNVCAQVSEEYGLQKLWNETNAKLEEHYAIWNNCASHGNIISIYKWVLWHFWNSGYNSWNFNFVPKSMLYHFRCRTKEALAIYHILDEFMVEAGYESDDAPMVIVRDYVKYCKFDPSVWSNSITSVFCILVNSQNESL